LVPAPVRCIGRCYPLVKTCSAFSQRKKERKANTIERLVEVPAASHLAIRKSLVTRIRSSILLNRAPCILPILFPALHRPSSPEARERLFAESRPNLGRARRRAAENPGRRALACRSRNFPTSGRGIAWHAVDYWLGGHGPRGRNGGALLRQRDRGRQKSVVACKPNAAPRGLFWLAADWRAP